MLNGFKLYTKKNFTTRNVAICDDLLVTPLTFVIEWFVICDEISIFVIGAMWRRFGSEIYDENKKSVTE
jgi:hypothetical protein